MISPLIADENMDSWRQLKISKLLEIELTSLKFNLFPLNLKYILRT